MVSEAFLVRRPCLGGQLWSHRPPDGESVEHFSVRIVITKKGPSPVRGAIAFEH